MAPLDAPYRILVIDDEQVVLDASSRLLSAEGLEVVTALDAETGIELLETSPPDVAVVDLKLPGLSGIEFMEAAHERYPQLRIILTTGVASADQAVAALNHGAFDFLPKPFTYEELMSPVLRACRDASLPASGDSDAGVSERLYLGLQAWALPLADTSIRLGATDRFQQTTGKILEINHPRINEELRQGGPLARVRTADARWHVVLAAAGGRVTEINQSLSARPGLLNDDPEGAAWIAVIQTTELHRDLPNLGTGHGRG
jgi:DNA-binding response OmpR family regulator